MGTNSTNNVSAKLYDATGALLQDMGYMQPTMAYTIDLTRYPTGVYLLHMNDGRQDVVKRIVKE
jgi:hypothetical protein